MITVKLLGGLGNQLFQYAFARVLSLQLGCPIQFDVQELGRRDVRTHSQRELGLDRFPHLAAGRAEGTLIHLLNHPAAVVRHLARRHAPWRFVYVRQTGLLLPSLEPDPRRDYYLDGYFVGHRHLEAHRDRLLADLAEPRIEHPGYGALLEEIQAGPNAVFVHVRRGDYFSPALAPHYGLCAEPYYRAALARMGQQLGAPFRCFVFSDDIAWVRSRLELPPDTRFVSDGRLDPVEELSLMAACRHGIIANSTFSWWGAWLMANPGKVIVTPAEWLRNPAVPHDFDELVPPRWTRITLTP